ncbi:TolC family outer membrane protein [Catenovulum sp. SM1970]|uniref:TolC family outer membrane protein n=1 Tax=Marinifaba aquimaris TaxID=2741323 RepID=UPI0015720EE7|nr:TolC family outer membrane protein [Marinifaba aquimaris]NTS75630.1 TolC family outer membrane protein [Marinifaba aquimaris]
MKLKYIASAMTALGLGLSVNLAHAKSLEQTVATAFNTNPELKAVYHRYRSSEQVFKEAKGGWYPSIDLSASVGVGEQDSQQTRANIEDEEIEPISYGITLEQLLFDGFYTSENINRTEHELSSEKYLLLDQAENTALEIASTYLEVLKQKQLVELAQKNLDSHQEIFEQIQLRTESGLGTTSDLSQIRGRLARAHANLISSKNNYADTVNAYVRLVGEMPGELVSPVADQILLPASEGQLLDLAKDSHPTLLAASSDVRAAQAQLGQSESAYFPKVTLELSNRVTDDNNNDNVERDELRADLIFSYNLFRGGQDKAKELQSAYQIEQAKELQISAMRQVVEGAKFAWNAYQFTEDQITHLQLHVEQSYLTQQAYKKQFDLGRRTLLDLLDTENELFEARRNYIDAEANYIVAKYRVLNSMGRLLKGLRINSAVYWQGIE